MLGIIAVLFLAACTTPVAPPRSLTPTGTDTPARPSAPAPTDTPAATHTNAFTPTPTDTPTIAFTPTPSFTPTPGFNAPGEYPVRKCGSFAPGGVYAAGIENVRVCIESVRVNDDRTMQFNVRWRVSFKDAYTFPVGPYAGDKNILLIDDLENEYHHTQVGGCAAAATELTTDRSECAGWFLFPAASPGATSFRFIDFLHLMSIDGIVLRQTETPTPAAQA
jgi:hypothetical protein